jgi:hypothetical protein
LGCIPFKIYLTANPAALQEKNGPGTSSLRGIRGHVVWRSTVADLENFFKAVNIDAELANLQEISN